MDRAFPLPPSATLRSRKLTIRTSRLRLAPTARPRRRRPPCHPLRCTTTRCRRPRTAHPPRAVRRTLVSRRRSSSTHPPRRSRRARERRSSSRRRPRRSSSRRLRAFRRRFRHRVRRALSRTAFPAPPSAPSRSSSSTTPPTLNRRRPPIPSLVPQLEPSLNPHRAVPHTTLPIRFPSHFTGLPAPTAHSRHCIQPCFAPVVMYGLVTWLPRDPYHSEWPSRRL